MLYTIKVSGQPGRCKRESLRPLWSRWEPKQPNRVLLSPKGRIFSYKPFRRPDTIGIPADLLAEQETFPDPECDFPQVFEPEIRAGTQQVFEMLSAISTVENLLLDIFPTPDAIDYETYSARINLGQPRSGQVTPYRRMGGADDTKNSNSCPLNLPS